MKKGVNKVKDMAEVLSETKSKDYMRIYFDLIDLFNDYFEEESINYIKNLKDYPKIEIKKTDFLKRFIEKLQIAYLLGQFESDEDIKSDLELIGISDNIIEPLSSDLASSYAKIKAAEAITMINETTRTVIHGIINKGIEESISLKEIARQIKDKFSDFSIYRSTLISTMELANAYSEGQKKQYETYAKKIGVTGWKKSVTHKDSNVRDSHRVNEEAGWIPMDEPFPGTLTQTAPHGFMCRCHIVYSLIQP